MDWLIAYLQHCYKIFWDRYWMCITQVQSIGYYSFPIKLENVALNKKFICIVAVTNVRLIELGIFSIDQKIRQSIICKTYKQYESHLFSAICVLFIYSRKITILEVTVNLTCPANNQFDWNVILIIRKPSS